MGEHLRSARERLNLTVEQAAQRIGVRPKVLLEWEEGADEPVGFDLIRMAEVYECSPDELLGLPKRRQ